MFRCFCSKKLHNFFVLITVIGQVFFKPIYEADIYFDTDVIGRINDSPAALHMQCSHKVFKTLILATTILTNITES